MRSILASQSPRRRELLERMGIFAFEVIPARGEEVVHPGLAPARLVEELLLSQEAGVIHVCHKTDPALAGQYDGELRMSKGTLTRVR